MIIIDFVLKGEMVLCILVMLVDINVNGDIFGGWLMLQMDIGGVIMVKEIVQGCVVIVWVDGMIFLCLVVVGDVVCCYVCCVKCGNILVIINIEVWVKKVFLELIGQCYKVMEVLFIYVVVDNQGKLCFLLVE